MYTKSNYSLLAFFYFISIAIVFESVLLFSQNEIFESISLVVLYLFCVISIELLLLFLLSRKFQWLFITVLSALLTSNLFILKLFFWDFFQGLTYPAIIISIFITFSIIYSVVYLISKRSKIIGYPMYLFLSLILIATPLAAVLFENVEIVEMSDKSLDIIDKWEEIEFKETPNIHLISFDSMIPKRIAERYMDIRELPYEKFIKNNALRQSPSFSNKVPSKGSLNAVMNLDQLEVKHRNDVFSGEVPSILTTVMKNNGYDITTGYSSYYLGKKGPFIDNYNVYLAPKLKKSILCVDEGHNIIMQSRLFLACSVLGKYSGIVDVISASLNKKNSGVEWVSKVLDTIKGLSLNVNPQLTFHYIYRPIGHASSDYDHTDDTKRKAYIKYFLNGAARLDSVLHRISTLIKVNDPNSIVVIFGDHGAWLSRAAIEKEQPEFYFSDRHSVELIVLKTGHTCSSKEVFHYSNKFSTPSRVVAAVLRCLSKDPGVVDKLIKFNDDEIDNFVDVYENSNFKARQVAL